MEHRKNYLEGVQSLLELSCKKIATVHAYAFTSLKALTGLTIAKKQIWKGVQ